MMQKIIKLSFSIVLINVYGDIITILLVIICEIKKQTDYYFFSLKLPVSHSRSVW